MMMPLEGTRSCKNMATMILSTCLPKGGYCYVRDYSYNRVQQHKMLTWCDSHMDRVEK
jgi:hypothetical protein